MNPRLRTERGEPDRAGTIEGLWVIIKKKKRFCGIHGGSVKKKISSFVSWMFSGTPKHGGQLSAGG